MNGTTGKAKGMNDITGPQLRPLGANSPIPRSGRPCRPGRTTGANWNSSTDDKDVVTAAMIEVRMRRDHSSDLVDGHAMLVQASSRSWCTGE